MSIDLKQLFASLERALTQSLPVFNDFIDGATKSAITLVTTLLNIFVGAIVSIYLLYSKERFAAQAKKVLFALLPRNFTLKAIDLLSQTDKIVMYGDGNATKMVRDVMNSSSQVLDGLKESTGIDLAGLLASYAGAKAGAGETKDEK